MQKTTDYKVTAYGAHMATSGNVSPRMMRIINVIGQKNQTFTESEFIVIESALRQGLII